ncbi:MAG: hypothetical protein KA740_11505 [Rhodoferax sp.]|jgi:hypothetical protein|nr:hypothetical protein [Rhodoferax sp.]
MRSKKHTSEAEQAEVQAPVAVHGDTDNTEANQMANNFAKLIVSPEYAAYRVIAAAEPKDLTAELDIPVLLTILKDQGVAANRNDLSQAETMLANQATALQSLFARMAVRASRAEHMVNFEILMRVALKAQSQCRATLETLAAIKNPPIVYAKQANVTTGPQQINNGIAHTGENKIRTNKLLAADHGNFLDTRAQAAPTRVDPGMGPMDKVNRA